MRGRKGGNGNLLMCLRIRERKIERMVIRAYIKAEAPAVCLCRGLSAPPDQARIGAGSQDWSGGDCGSVGNFSL